MMKKNILLSAIVLISVVFSGCYNPVFYNIMGDVAPEDATVSGNINSITRYTINGEEYLALAADGGLRYKAVKDGFHGAWNTFSEDNLPFKPHSYDYFTETHSGEQILKVLADSTTLYLVTASYVNDTSQGTTITDKVKMYAAIIPSVTAEGKWNTPEKWETIIDESNSSTYFPTYIYSYYNYTAFAVFQTNAPKTEHRKVFIRTGNKDAHYTSYQSVKYYEVSGLNEPKEISVTPQETLSLDSTTNNANSAVWFNGHVLFFNCLASTTNETYEADPTYFYFYSYNNKKNQVYHSNTEGSVADSTLDAGAKVSALMTCSDALIIGRGNFEATSTSGGGLKKTTLTDGVPGTEVSSFSTNASFQISSSYYVTSLVNATPDQAELDSDLYAAITYIGTGTSTSVSSKNRGLWSYYPSRGNWNRE